MEIAKESVLICEWVNEVVLSTHLPALSAHYTKPNHTYEHRQPLNVTVNKTWIHSIFNIPFLRVKDIDIRQMFSKVNPDDDELRRQVFVFSGKKKSEKKKMCHWKLMVLTTPVCVVQNQARTPYSEPHMHLHILVPEWWRYVLRFVSLKQRTFDAPTSISAVCVSSAEYGNSESNINIERIEAFCSSYRI